ncbi:hypothetical protein J6590_026492 [Homalodisca vitripennis]|nr:hypothetical protein J6590_026492 [Homalodisca vitripennis]
MKGCGFARRPSRQGSLVYCLRNVGGLVQVHRHATHLAHSSSVRKHAAGLRNKEWPVGTIYFTIIEVTTGSDSLAEGPPLTLYCCNLYSQTISGHLEVRRSGVPRLCLSVRPSVTSVPECHKSVRLNERLGTMGCPPVICNPLDSSEACGTVRSPRAGACSARQMRHSAGLKVAVDLVTSHTLTVSGLPVVAQGRHSGQKTDSFLNTKFVLNPITIR